jgi:hypothetical protein
MQGARQVSQCPSLNSIKVPAANHPENPGELRRKTGEALVTKQPGGPREIMVVATGRIVAIVGLGIPGRPDAAERQQHNNTDDAFRKRPHGGRSECETENSELNSARKCLTAEVFGVRDAPGERVKRALSRLNGTRFAN